MRGHKRLMLVGATLTVVSAIAGPAVAVKPQTSSVFLVQGVVGSSWDFAIDGEPIERGVAAKGVVGPIDVDPGKHRVSARSGEGDEVEGMFRIGTGASVDMVLHLPVDASQQPVLTRFTNDLAPVPDGQTRLSIAHTAAVGPADITVDGKVLFADVASGEELTVTVPADTYRVAVVPSATNDPPVLGPVDLVVPAGQLMRVFAVGVAEQGTMDAVVHQLPVPTRGSASSPAGVPGGTGGHHDPSTGPDPLVWAGLGCLVAGLVVGASPLRRRSAARRT